MVNYNYIKIGIYSFIAGCLLTCLAIKLNNNSRDNKLQQQYKQLQLDYTKLKCELKDNSEKLVKDDEKINELTKITSNDKTENDKLRKQLNDIKQPKPVLPIKNVQDVKDRICTLYKDCDVNETNGFFNIKYQTTSSILIDAEKWTTQGPYLQDKLNTSLSLNDSLQKNVNDYEKLDYEKDVKITDLLKRDFIHENVETNLNKQNLNLNNRLTIEKQNGKIYFVKGALIGVGVTGVTFVIVKLIRK
jgi:hypothetical protein